MDGRKGKLWDKLEMANAVKAVKRKEVGFQDESKAFEVPRSTLNDKVNSTETDKKKVTNTQLGRKPELS